MVVIFSILTMNCLWATVIILENVAYFDEKNIYYVAVG